MKRVASRFFAAKAAEQIHEGALALLMDPGVRFEHDGIAARLRQAGARPGHGAQVWRLPRELVQECLDRAPRRVTFADRRGTAGATVVAPTPSTRCPTRVWSTPGLHLWHRGQHRRFTAADMVDFARLLDHLPHVDGVFGLALDDVPPAARDIVGLRIMAEHTAKHIRVMCFSPAGADALCAAKPVLGDAPWFSIGFTAHGPLRWTHLALEIFARTAGHGIPTTINGEPMAGVSGPITLAGAAAVGNAEILAGLVVNQLLEPGRPCIYNLGLAHVFDMRTAVAVTGGPENQWLADLSAVMGRFYRLPSCGWVSTEAMCADGQAAIEKELGFLSQWQSGVSLIWGVGQLESEMTVSPAQAVIDDEILGLVQHYLRATPVTAETLALDVIREVGIAGSFLEHEHTLARCRDAFFLPRLLWRRQRGAWTAAGAKTLAQAAEDRADELLALPRPPLLTDDQTRALRAIEDRVLQGQRARLP